MGSILRFLSMHGRCIVHTENLTLCWFSTATERIINTNHIYTCIRCWTTQHARGQRTNNLVVALLWRICCYLHSKNLYNIESTDRFLLCKEQHFRILRNINHVIYKNGRSHTHSWKKHAFLTPTLEQMSLLTWCTLQHCLHHLNLEYFLRPIALLIWKCIRTNSMHVYSDVRPADFNSTNFQKDIWNILFTLLHVILRKLLILQRRKKLLRVQMEKYGYNSMNPRQACSNCMPELFIHKIMANCMLQPV